MSLPPGLPLPNALHWLGDRAAADATQHAADAKGCVMYFASERDCERFMRWLTGYVGSPLRQGYDDTAKAFGLPTEPR